MPYRFGRLHCHCRKPNSLECMTRGVLAKTAVERLTTQTILRGQLEVIKVLDHIYIVSDNGSINNVVRLLFQFNVAAVLVRLHTRSLLVCNGVGVEHLLNIVKFFNVKRPVRWNENSTRFFPVTVSPVCVHSTPKPEKSSANKWTCWWLIEICSCGRAGPRCVCRIRFQKTEVDESIVEMALLGRLKRPKMLVSYIVQWFILKDNVPCLRN